MKRITNSSYIKRLINSKYVVKNDNFDIMNFQKMISINTDLMSNYLNFRDYPQMQQLQQDLFSSLYKYNPKILEGYEIDYDYWLNADVMRTVMESRQYKELRALTRLELVNAAIGTKMLAEDVKKIIEELKERSKDLEDAVKNAKAAADTVKQVEQDNSAKQQLEQSQGAGKGEDGEEPGKDYLTLEEAIEKLRKAEEKLEKSLLTPKEKREVVRAITTAVSQTKEVSDLITDWGLQQSDSFTRIGYQEQLSIVKKLQENTKLRAIASIMGRYKRMVLAQKQTKIKKGSDSLYDIVLGNDLGRIIPSEALKLKHPTTRPLFFKNYYEKTLLQHEYEGRAKKHKGAIAIAIDESGSMSGEKEIWAKALALGLLEIARLQKRNLFIVHFNANRKESLRVDTFLKTDPYNVEKIIDCCTYFANGGTNFMPSLDLCREKISMEKDFTTADIIMLTDGASAVLPTWCNNYNTWKVSEKIKVYTVLIDYGYHYAKAVEMFSDDVTLMSEFTEQSKDAFMFKMINAL